MAKHHLKIKLVLVDKPIYEKIKKNKGIIFYLDKFFKPKEECVKNNTLT